MIGENISTAIPRHAAVDLLNCSAKGLVSFMKTAFSTRLPLVVGMWITGGVALLGLGAAALRPKAVATVSSTPITPSQLTQKPHCQTVAADPQPPLNVRSQPHATSSQNIIGTVGNGTVLRVIGHQSQWLQVTQPIQGWVYQPLTATNCRSGNHQAIASTDFATPNISPSAQVIHRATQQFQAGQMQTALSLLESIAHRSPEATSAYNAMVQQWQQGNTTYTAAQKAAKSGQWQTILQQVTAMPPVHYWHGKMAPLVKQAIVQHRTIE